MGKDKSLGPHKTCEKKDYISELPEEILHHILTFLPISYLVSASEISKYFNHLSKSIPYISLTCRSVLQQDPHTLIMSDKTNQPGCRENRATQFVHRADELVKHHHGKQIQFLKVHFTLNSEHASSIDNWVKFAIDADAREIVLNFKDSLSPPYGKIYKFPYWFFTGTEVGKELSLRQLTLVNCSLKVPSNSYRLNSLQSLHLKAVRLSTNDHVANLLSCCTKLSWLWFDNCEGLEELRISNTCHKLQFLRVDSHRELKLVTISDTNLQTFEYHPYNKNFSEVKFEKVLMLSRFSEFFPQAGPSASLDDVLTGNTSNLCGSLQTMYLSLRSPFELLWPPSEYCTYPRLKKLILHIKTTPTLCFLDIVHLLKVMPYVQEIHIEIDVSGKPQSKKLEKISAEDFLLVFLRSVRIGGFKTDPGHIELAMYLVNNAPNLETLIIDTQKQVYKGEEQWEKVDTGNDQMQLNARRAKLSSIFSDKIPPTVMLEIL